MRSSRAASAGAYILAADWHILLGDFGGGGLYLVVGVLAALLEARSSGRGQVVDAAIVDGTAHLSTFLVGLVDGGLWSEARGTNLLDGGAPFYDVYATSDGEWLAVGPLEERFWGELVGRLGLDDPAAPALPDRREPSSGRSCGAGSPRSSPPAAGTSGPPSSRGRTRASHPS